MSNWQQKSQNQTQATEKRPPTKWKQKHYKKHTKIYLIDNWKSKIYKQKKNWKKCQNKNNKSLKIRRKTESKQLKATTNGKQNTICWKSDEKTAKNVKKTRKVKLKFTKHWKSEKTLQKIHLSPPMTAAERQNSAVRWAAELQKLKLQFVENQENKIVKNSPKIYLVEN